MIQPEELKTSEPLIWSPGRGTEVWEMFRAAITGDLEAIKRLVNKDGSLVRCSHTYRTPLYFAVRENQVEVAAYLLEHGTDPNLPEEGIAPQGHALYSAVYHGHFDIAKLLLEHGAFPNPPVESSADALSIAIRNSDEKMVELLCSYGATRSVDLLAHYGDVKTAVAVFAANPALAHNPGALASAAGNGHEGFIRLMLRYQPDPPQRVAVNAKTRELTELLFRHGMNPSRPDWLGVTPLHEFARKGDVDKATIFIDHGADLHARDEDICSTPLGSAAKFGKKDMVELLLSRGAKPNLPDDPPWATPLAWATRRGHGEIANLLKQHGAM